MQMRIKQGRNPEPSAAAIDSQSIKTSPVRGPEKGYDPGKKSMGAQTTHPGGYRGQSARRQSHRSAPIGSARGKRLVLPLCGDFPRLQLIWGDSHYGGT